MILRFQKEEASGQALNVSECCQALNVSRSGFYDHLSKPERPRALADQQLAEEVQAEFTANRGSYGSRRIQRALRRKGRRHSRRRVARLMRTKRLQGRQKGRFRPKTTDSRHGGPIAPNLLLDASKPTAANQIWVTDVTYIMTTEGWRYLSATLDLCTRKVLAWNIADTLETSLCTTTLQKALEQECPAAHRLIHHSDRGVQYASFELRSQLALSKIKQSMSRKGNCYDNATMESFWATYKTDCLQDLHERKITITPEALETLTFEYMTIIYNTQRLHSSLDYMTPVEFEKSLPTASPSLTQSYS
jgi:putative transposase